MKITFKIELETEDSTTIENFEDYIRAFTEGEPDVTVTINRENGSKSLKCEVK